MLFNSIKGKQYEHIDLKPIMYQDVTKLSKEKQKYEEMLKKAVTNAGQKDNLDLSLLWKMETTSQSDASTISVSSSSSSTYITANDAGKCNLVVYFFLNLHTLDFNCPPWCARLLLYP